MRATALVFDQSGADAARVVIAADVDVNGFSFEPEENSRLGGAVEFAVAATHLATGRVYHFDQTVEMHLSPETRRRLGVTWYSMSRDFTLPSGAYQAKVVVRDRTSGLVGSVTHGFEVPPLGGFRVSSPILTDTLQADSTGKTMTAPVLVARRTFLGNATLFCQYTVFGAARDGAGQPARLGQLDLEAGQRDRGPGSPGARAQPVGRRPAASPVWNCTSRPLAGGLRADAGGPGRARREGCGAP